MQPFCHGGGLAAWGRQNAALHGLPCMHAVLQVPMESCKQPLRFDSAMMDWAATGNQQQLLETAASAVDAVVSCGFMGSVMLQGMLSSAAAATGTSVTDSSSNNGGAGTDDCAAGQKQLPVLPGQRHSSPCREVLLHVRSTAGTWATSATRRLGTCLLEEQVLGYGRPHLLA